MHAHLIPSYYLARVAATTTIREGAPLWALADRIRSPLFDVGGALSALNPLEQGWLKQKVAKLAEVFRRSSSHVEGRNGYLSLDHPRKRQCLTAMHHFFSHILTA